MMLSITALRRRLTLAPEWPSTWTVGSMPALAMKPLDAAAAMRPSSVVARAIAVAACRAWAACAEESGPCGTYTGAGGMGAAAIGAWPATGVAWLNVGGGT